MESEKWKVNDPVFQVSLTPGVSLPGTVSLLKSLRLHECHMRVSREGRPAATSPVRLHLWK